MGLRKTHKLAIDCRVEAAAGRLDVLGVLDGREHRSHELVIDSGSGATQEHVMFFAFLMSVSTIFEVVIDCRIRAVQVKRVIQRIKRRCHRLKSTQTATGRRCCWMHCSEGCSIMFVHVRLSVDISEGGEFGERKRPDWMSIACLACALTVGKGQGPDLKSVVCEVAHHVRQLHIVIHQMHMRMTEG